MSFTVKFRQALVSGLCSMALVGVAIAPTTPASAQTQSPSAVVAQEDLSSLNQTEGDATPQAVSPQARFLDVPVDYPFYPEISWLYNRKITIGYPDQTYRPQQYIERSGIAVYFYRLAGSPAVDLPDKSPFTDVSPNDTWYKEMVWFSQQKLTTGYADGTFRPHELVSRDAMAAFFYRFAGSPQFTAPAESPFWDVDPSEPFYREILWLRTVGITNGWADGSYRPQDPISREAMAAFIYRFAHLKR